MTLKFKDENIKDSHRLRNRMKDIEKRRLRTCRPYIKDHTDTGSSQKQHNGSQYRNEEIDIGVI